MIWLLKVRELKQGDLSHCSDSHQTGTACARCPRSCILLGKAWDELGEGRRGQGSEQCSQELPERIWDFLVVSGSSPSVKKQMSSFIPFFLSPLTSLTALLLGGIRTCDVDSDVGAARPGPGIYHQLALGQQLWKAGQDQDKVFSPDKWWLYWFLAGKDLSPCVHLIMLTSLQAPVENNGWVFFHFHISQLFSSWLD